jgi:hypothetical protein
LVSIGVCRELISAGGGENAVHQPKLASGAVGNDARGTPKLSLRAKAVRHPLHAASRHGLGFQRGQIHCANHVARNVCENKPSQGRGKRKVEGGVKDGEGPLAVRNSDVARISNESRHSVGRRAVERHLTNRVIVRVSNVKHHGRHGRVQHDAPGLIKLR